ncbi:hypothetical protein ACWD4G_26435 [Streptomyces sp. NPDC002643]
MTVTRVRPSVVVSSPYSTRPTQAVDSSGDSLCQETVTFGVSRPVTGRAAGSAVAWWSGRVESPMIQVRGM